MLPAKNYVNQKFRPLNGIVTLTATVRAFDSPMLPFMPQLSLAAIYNIFYTQRHLISRKTLRQFRTEAMSVWKIVTAA